MNAKKGILIGVVAVVVLFLIAFGMQAMAMNGENSSLETMLKAELASHALVDDVQQKLTAMSYQVKTNPDGSLDATGPSHSVIVYSSRITAHVTFNQDKQNTGYKIDHGPG